MIARGDVYSDIYRTNEKKLSDYEEYLISEGYITREWAEKRSELWWFINTVFSKSVFSYKWELYDADGKYIEYLPDILSKVEDLTHYDYDFLSEAVFYIGETTDTQEEFLEEVKSMLWSALELDLC